MAESSKHRKLLITLVYVILIGAVIYIIVTQLHTLKDSFRLMSSSNKDDFLAAAGLIFLTFVSAAQSYYFLAFKKLRMLRTLLVEFAITSINKIVPSGLGGLASNYDYLRKAGHSEGQAASVAAINNTLGFLANMFIIILLLIFVRSNPLKIGHINSNYEIIAGSVLAVVLISMLVLAKLRRRILSVIGKIYYQIKTYEGRPSSIVFSFITQVSLCLANVLALYFSLQAVHVNLALTSVMLSYSFAIWLGAILPTPGGLGAVETGLTGALVAFGVKLDVAISGVLLFRLLSYWTPLILGSLALIWSRKRKYL